MAERVNWKARALRAEKAMAQIRASVSTWDEGPTVKKAPASKPKQHENTKQLIDLFDEMYRKAYRVKPTWGAKQVKLINDLAKQHSYSEISNRMGRLLSGSHGLDWLKPPFAVETLRGNFDRLVPVCAKNHAKAERAIKEYRNLRNDLIAMRVNGREHGISDVVAGMHVRTQRLVASLGNANDALKLGETEFVRLWELQP